MDRVSEVIFSYAARIGQAQDPDSLLVLNAAMARDLVGADRCSLWLLDEAAGQLRTKVAHGVDEIRIAAGHGLAGACISSGQAIVVNDTSSDPRFLGQVDQSSGYVTRSVLVVPLHSSSGQVLGALQALNKPDGFSPEDVDLISLAASYAASTIEGQQLRQEAEDARVLVRELEIARGVQNRLFPQQLPAVDGLDCAAYCRPARFVGGDYYDFVQLSPSSLALTLGDVAGKGVAAAVLMASVHASLRTQLLQAPTSLASMVNDFNKVVHSISSSERYTTLFCGLIDRHKLVYVNAGNEPPMLVRHSSPTPIVERLDAGGMPVGLMGIARYEQAELDLHPGDLLVSFSDGIGEATNEHGEIWEEVEIEKILLDCPSLTAQQVVNRIVAAADGFTGAAEQADDMTVVAARVL
jgi:sigma-B regulation protein RsbU (phosphoserine phosphatase)